MPTMQTEQQTERKTTRHCISVSAATFTALREYAERRGTTMGKVIAALLRAE